EDGTMVVVDNARVLIGKTVPVSIISLMQTNAGRLAFGRLLDTVDGENAGSGEAIPVLESPTPPARVEMAKR
ncbi:MAG TPA: PIN domain nuclease, partial [Candidatus Sumerlaeota bacterium]|nr:PIN domain nuclease [Candidatus Sumerlaeota bacterium]